MSPVLLVFVSSRPAWEMAWWVRFMMEVTSCDSFMMEFTHGSPKEWPEKKLNRHFRLWNRGYLQHAPQRIMVKQPSSLTGFVAAPGSFMMWGPLHIAALNMQLYLCIYTNTHMYMYLYMYMYTHVVPAGWQLLQLRPSSPKNCRPLSTAPSAWLFKVLKIC